MPSKELTTPASATLQDEAIQVQVTLAMRSRRQGSAQGRQPNWVCAEAASPVPRITRLMALAIKFQEMINRGEVRDYADLARLGYVTRARLTQIMNLLLLAPDIQFRILHAVMGDVPGERLLRRVVSQVLWSEQRHTMKCGQLIDRK